VNGSNKYKGAIFDVLRRHFKKPEHSFSVASASNAHPSHYQHNKNLTMI
jgi:hypothetical protein